MQGFLTCGKHITWFGFKTSGWFSVHTGVSFFLMSASIDDLLWNTPSVLNLLVSEGIDTRRELARRIGTSHAVVMAAFDENWNGRATTTLISRLARYFHVTVTQLIVEPITRQAKTDLGRQNGRLVR